MNRYISKKDRNFVKERASACCEYCKVPELFSLIGYEIDHIISLKHGGSNKVDNLAYSCPICNYCKGTDIATMLLPDNTPIRFYNPRLDKWQEHFRLSSGALIEPKTKMGEATIKIFKLNELERTKERVMLISAGLFPTP